MNSGGSIFGVFVGNPHPRIWNHSENNFRQSYLCCWNSNRRIHEITAPRMSKKVRIHENCSHEFKWFHSNIYNFEEKLGRGNIYRNVTKYLFFNFNCLLKIIAPQQRLAHTHKVIVCCARIMNVGYHFNILILFRCRVNILKNFNSTNVCAFTVYR